MNSPQDPNPSTTPVNSLPSGESLTGVVRKVAETPENSPVLEHRAAVAEDVPSDVEAAKPVVHPAAEAPGPAPVAASPEPIPAATPTPVPARATPRPLQEISKVSIPVRMNQLQTDHQRLRDELQALEDALKSPPN